MPEKTIHFQDGQELTADLPHNTLDPRYSECTDHRLACMCREAHMAEDRHEFIAERELAKRAFNDVLKDHNTFPADGLECRCTGCEIARRVGQVFRSYVDVVYERRDRRLSGGGA
ncbi:hypothetical protein E1264_28520 [Actinomadura sp. KC216]|uniref:hypothetical protein n=1 Tax=Actinomadura sp. KC216 TaxID=2530370 RepID=UPI00104C989A|nr:hypothetical protein [Actinomadura sp. KC216]TDB83425.1 hypothetical protein E1264_28520 [Actinomadura sp. KC216]